MATAEDHYYTAEFTVYGPITQADVNLLLDDVLAAVEARGAYMGGGFIKVDDSGLPGHLTGLRRALWRLGQWLMDQAVLA